MAFGMFSSTCSPIAIDFGTSSVKLLQIGSEDKPSLVAAAEIAMPMSATANAAEAMDFLSRELPKALRDGHFKGRRAACTVPGGQTLIQHMQLPMSDGVTRENQVKAQLQAQFGWPSSSVVVRAIEVIERPKDDQTRMETLCLAMTRESVMRHVELLRKCRLEVVGVHTEVMAMVRAFDHLNRRQGDENISTMYIDIGYGSTKVAIRHGLKLVFAKCIQLGGRHLDQLISETLHCDLHSARAHRLSQESPLKGQPAAREDTTNAASAQRMTAVMRTALSKAGTGSGPTTGNLVAAMTEMDRRVGQAPAELRQEVPENAQLKAPSKVDFSELLQAISDELRMCVRYHRSLFPGRPIDRVVFLGGEARQMGLCRHLAQALAVTAQVGDPLARLAISPDLKTPGLTLGRPQPGWAVAYGLCTAPTDL